MSEETMEMLAMYAAMGAYGDDFGGMDPMMLGVLGGRPELMFMGPGGIPFDNYDDEEDDYYDDDEDGDGMADGAPPLNRGESWCAVCRCVVSTGNLPSHEAGRKHTKALRNRGGQQPPRARGHRAEDAPRLPQRSAQDFTEPRLHSAVPSYSMTRGDIDARRIPALDVRCNADLDVARAPGTRVLRVRDRTCDPDCLVAFARHAPTLQHLEVVGATHARALLDIAMVCPLIEVLDAKAVSGLGKQEFIALLRYLPRLVYIDLRDTRIGERMASEFPVHVDYETTHPDLLVDL